MEFEKENLYNGFKLVSKEFIQEIKSAALVFEHEKSGAKLLKLENEDNNKLFSICFRTPPTDSTGVPHILEHSVLCGSRKFDTKEPFVELIKGSLNTFLNAMTFADKTMYPVASKNTKDFFNLMDVYLDATLYPNIHRDDRILMQEGWHYEIEDKNDPLTIKGVVYNEMKGAFSSPVRVLYSKLEQFLYPETTYGNESGGDPEFIPDLTQKDFSDFHSKYYHPSNSYIFLYGNGNTEEELKFIDNNYLKDFDRITVDSSITLQKAFDKKNYKELSYAISEGESTDNKTFYAMGFSTGLSTDALNYHVMDILNYILLESQAAPLKKALLKNNIGQDILGLCDNGILQPVFGVIVKNSSEDKQQQFEDIFNSTLKDIVKNGLDKELIEAAINRHEFMLREAEFGYPKGLVYHMVSMTSWLYDGDPVSLLKIDDVINDIREKSKNGLFEDFIQKNILDNSHSVLVKAIPEPGLNKKNNEILSKKLAEIKERMNDEELETVIENTRRLKERQTSVDTPEKLSCIPLLKIEDIDPVCENLPLEVKEEENVKYMISKLNTNRICYLDLMFDTTCVTKENIPYIKLLAGLLGKISTKDNAYEDLSNIININTGGIRFEEKCVINKDNNSIYNPFLVVRGKSLEDKFTKMTEIMNDIIGNTLFEDTDRIITLIRELKSRFEMFMMNSGHEFAKKRMYSYISQSGRYEEEIGGVAYYKFLCEIEKNWENNNQNILDTLSDVFKSIFARNNLTVSITAEENKADGFIKNVSDVVNSLPYTELTKNTYTFELEKGNEGLESPSQVQYVVKGANFKNHGYEFNGSFDVVKTVSGLDYLWNKVRVLGGAYGAFIRFDRSGNYFLGSYRDPNLKETLDNFDGISEYLKDFTADDREMRKYIIGSISDMDRHLSPHGKGEESVKRYISGINSEDMQRERDEILSTKVEDIKEFAEIFDKTLKENNICVFGNKGKIQENKEVFNKTLQVF